MRKDGYDSCYRVAGVTCPIGVGVLQNIRSGNAQVEGSACWCENGAGAVYVIGPGCSVLGVALAGVEGSRRWTDEGHHWGFRIDSHFYRSRCGRSFWWDDCDFWVAACQDSRTSDCSPCGRSWLASESWDCDFRSASHWFTGDHYVAARWVWSRGTVIV